MLAQTATDVGDAIDAAGRHGGVRGQARRRPRAGAPQRPRRRDLHPQPRRRDGRLPEVVEATLALPVDTLVADGEAIALRPDNRPHRFQVTASRFGRSVDIDAARAAQPLSVFLFDVLHLDGRDLLDEPGEQRAAALAEIVPARYRVDRLVTDDAAAAQDFLERTLAAGHEGVVAKSLTAPYEAGRRGAGWLKIKPVHTLDLVVLAVEWGSGRRRGKLSNIHLGARDAGTGELVMLGKTFKGMTDEMLAWQTERFLALADGRPTATSCGCAPSRSSRSPSTACRARRAIPGGMALRFARVLRYRDDKPVDEIDTLDTVRSLLRDDAVISSGRT